MCHKYTHTKKCWQYQHSCAGGRLCCPLQAGTTYLSLHWAFNNLTQNWEMLCGQQEPLEVDSQSACCGHLKLKPPNGEETHEKEKGWSWKGQKSHKCTNWVACYCCQPWVEILPSNHLPQMLTNLLGLQQHIASSLSLDCASVPFIENLYGARLNITMFSLA